MKRLAHLSLLILFCPLFLLGQKTYPVSFEHDGLKYEGKIEVAYIKSNPQPGYEPKEVNNVLQLVFRNTGEKLKLRLRKGEWAKERTERIQIRSRWIEISETHWSLPQQVKLDLSDDSGEIDLIAKKGGEGIIVITAKIGNNKPQVIIKQPYEMLIDAEEWAEASRHNSITGYRKYLEKFPNGLEANKALEKLQELSWTKINRAGDVKTKIALLQEFLAEFQTGSYSKKADAVLKGMDHRYFEQAVALKNREALDDYLNVFPDGLHRTEAQDRINDGNFEIAEVPEEPTVDEPVESGDDDDSTIPSESTQPTLSPAEQRWQDAQTKNTIYSYRKFIEDFPDNEYVFQAEEIIASRIAGIESRLMKPITSQQSRISQRKFRIQFQEAEYPFFIDSIAVLDAPSTQTSFVSEIDTSQTERTFTYNWRKGVVQATLDKDSLSMEIEVADALRYQLFVRDVRVHEAFEEPLVKKYDFIIDAKIPQLVVGDFSSDEDILRFAIKGGVPPYQMQVFKIGQEFADELYALDIEDAQLTSSIDPVPAAYRFEIPFSELTTSLNGSYQLIFTDSRRTEIVEGLEFQFEYQQPEPFAFWIIELVIFVLLSSWLIFRFVQIKRLYTT